jgi:thiol-disulfide isomerase/thioredoxin
MLADNGFVDLRGMEPPSLLVADSQGTTVRLAQLRGKLVVLNFWGTGCVHCMKEIPSLQELEMGLKGRSLAVIHVCADAEDANTAQGLVTKIAPGVRTFVVDSVVGLARFEVQTLPTVWLIGADGKAIGRSHGAKDWRSAALREMIEYWLPPTVAQ